MRRICIFCETWESGGIESFLHNLLLNMDRRGMEIDIVAAELRESVFTEELRTAGVRFVVLSGRQRQILRNHRLFRKLLAERRYDVVHLNVFQGLSLYYARLARKAGVPVRIAHSHNTALRRSLLRPVKLAMHKAGSRWFSADAADHWACSGPAAEFMFPADILSARGYTFIPNGIETARFRFDGAERDRMRRKLGIEGSFVVGSVGRLCYQKNQSFLLDVLAALLPQRPGSVLLLVGEGEDRPMLEEKVRRLGLEGSVIFYGTSSRVESLFWAMDAFVFPSLFEGLGIAAVEAQAAGLPTICSEYVPEEARTTALCRALALSAPLWAETLAAERSEGGPARSAYAEDILAAGYDVKAVAKQIEQVYRGRG